MTEKAKVGITIDGVTYEVNAGSNLLQECLSLGLDLPYFCWHPCMGSVGACRQCAVKQYRDAEDSAGLMTMACMTPVQPGARISIEDPEAKAFRAGVIESLMISHPHDCPVCEEGGECHLQDMTLMSGHNYRRYDKKKVTHRNQYLGPFINHEMNRCITCYRCVRFYNEYAGGEDLSAQASHHFTYFGRHRDGTLESEFSGNLVEVCPTGVFTDKVFSENYTRKWDLQTAPSICTGCGVGCNITPGERYGELRRVVNRYHSELNGYFICDRGRFGTGYVNDAARLATPLDGAGNELDAEAAGRQLREIAGNAIGIGSPRAGNEANFALRKLVGEENFHAGYSDAEHACMQLAAELAGDPRFHNPSIREIEQADAVLVLGEDVTNTAPRIALALRQSVHNKALELADGANIPRWQDAAVRELAQQERSPLCIFACGATRLDDVASDRVIDTPSGLVRNAIELAGRLDASAPRTAKSHEALERVAGQLLAARRPLIVAGTSSGNIDLIKAAANIAGALQKRRAVHENHGGTAAPVDLCLLTAEVNSMGLHLHLMTRQENSLGEALRKLSSGETANVIVLENDLYRRAPHAQVDAALDAARKTAVLDLLPNRTTAKADLVLPVTAFSEQQTSYVNYEGRAQLAYQVHRNHGAACPAWQWTGDFEHFRQALLDCAGSVAAFAKLGEVLPDTSNLPSGIKVPRQSERYSGRTAMKANLNVHEPKQAQDPESALAFSMEGIPPRRDATILASSWAPQWNSNQSISKFQDEINGPLRQGHGGTLLLEKKSEGGEFKPVPANGDGGGLELLPAFQIFGSEELSSRSEAIRARMTDAYLAVSPADAERHGLQ
ncbi:MAG: NADH-quinone oxidoreductase subunit NuoG, partial [Gammaproteobacteria bacterium]|nr:NADH-quinone oxidoreductase subunit NuoG [Gammaproteobacteria bacterium]